MTEEIQYYEEELTDLINEVKKGFDSLKRLTGAAKSERIGELQNRLQRAKQVLHSFKVEMRDLPRDRSGAYDAKAREFHAQLQSMHGELTLAKQEAERQQVGVKTVDEVRAPWRCPQHMPCALQRLSLMCILADRAVCVFR